MRRSIVPLLAVTAAAAVSPPSASAATFAATVVDGADGAALNPRDDVVGATVRFDDTKGRFRTTITYRGGEPSPGDFGGYPPAWVDVACVDATGPLWVRMQLARQAGATFARNTDIEGERFGGTARQALVNLPAHQVGTFEDARLIGVRCSDATLRQPPRPTTADHYAWDAVPPREARPSFPLLPVTGSDADTSDPSPADHAAVTEREFVSTIVDTDPPGDDVWSAADILGATVRYDDVAGRFTGTVQLRGRTAEGTFEPHRIEARCVDRQGERVTVVLWSLSGTEAWGVPATGGWTVVPAVVTDRANGNPQGSGTVGGRGQSAATAPTSAFVTVLDPRLAGFVCQDAAVLMDTQYVSRFIIPPEDRTDRVPFLATHRVPAPVEPGPAGGGPAAASASSAAPATAGPSRPGPAVRPTGRILDRAVRRGRAFRVRYRGGDRIVRVRYRRGGRTITKRFTVQQGVVRAGTRALALGTWRVSILDATGKVGSGTVRVRGR